MILMHRHAPKFIWIVKSSDSKKDLFIELSYLDILFFGLGLKFLSIDDKKEYSEFDISNYILKDNQTPLVIFPENTKTNRKGVLSIRSNLIDKIYESINEHGKLLIRSELIVKKFIHFSPSNTTDYLGLRTLFQTCSQFYNTVEVVSQDIPNNNFDKGLNYDRSKFTKVEDYLDANLQSHLVEPNSRNIVSLNSFSHISFLSYFHQTNKNASYVLKENKKE